MSRESDLDRIYFLVLELQDRSKRELALQELSKKRESVPDLAPILWYSYGTMSILSPRNSIPGCSRPTGPAICLAQILTNRARLTRLWKGTVAGVWGGGDPLYAETGDDEGHRQSFLPSPHRTGAIL